MIEDLRKEFAWPKHKPGVPKNMHGWFDDKKANALSGFENVNIILELGIWLGQSTKFFREQYPESVSICIDTWEGSAEHKASYAEYLPTLYETFLVNLWDYRRKIIPLKMSTACALGLVLGSHIESPDLIYIDASHEYSDVFLDLSLSFVFNDAHILGDDWHLKSVRDAVINVCDYHGASYRLMDDTWEIVR